MASPAACTCALSFSSRTCQKAESENITTRPTPLALTVCTIMSSVSGSALSRDV